MNSDGVICGRVLRAERRGDDLIDSIDRVAADLADGNELFEPEAGPVAPIGVRLGQERAQALQLERALRDLFIRWCDRPLDALVDRGRRYALGADDPFANSPLKPSERFRGSKS
ncbi:hypothetical protein [Salinisphaera hydrothermalis]|uniref:hypothetical protein n=1 Tax=Salinisphaera hydrothermalis TaxID=563188 RepID=UPI00333F8BBB